MSKDNCELCATNVYRLLGTDQPVEGCDGRLRETRKMRELVAALYVARAAVTALGVLLAYRRARLDLTSVNTVSAIHESHTDVNPVDTYEAARDGDADRLVAQAAVRATEQAALDQALEAAGITGGAARYKDLALPLEYWARRSALRDAVASFRRGGLVALAGVALSTVASVWSLYLPPS